MKSRILVVCLVPLAMLLATSPVVSAPTGGSSCATVTAYTTNWGSTVAPGSVFGITGKIINCSTGKARYTVNVAAMSSCGQKASIASSRMAFGPGEAKIWSISYTLPADTCSGTWEVTIQVNDRDGTLASASAAVPVQ